jgi:hypothetical protein
VSGHVETLEAKIKEGLQRLEAKTEEGLAELGLRQAQGQAYRDGLQAMADFNEGRQVILEEEAKNPDTSSMLERVRARIVQLRDDLIADADIYRSNICNCGVRCSGLLCTRICRFNSGNNNFRYAI